MFFGPPCGGVCGAFRVGGVDLVAAGYAGVYIYIYRERERDIHAFGAFGQINRTSSVQVLPGHEAGGHTERECSII